MPGESKLAWDSREMRAMRAAEILLSGATILGTNPEWLEENMGDIKQTRDDLRAAVEANK